MQRIVCLDECSDAFDDNNATSGIDDVNRVGGGDEYHQV